VLQKLLWMALAGGLGTLSRYGLAGFVQRMVGSGFPWGTLLVNVGGCFVFGILWAMLEMRLTITGELRTIVLVGFMGAFTTFSTFIFETSALLQDSEWILAIINLVTQNVGGVLFLLLGMAAGRLI